jgi:ABC-type phosphate transport system permease subunit
MSKTAIAASFPDGMSQHAIAREIAGAAKSAVNCALERQRSELSAVSNAQDEAHQLSLIVLHVRHLPLPPHMSQEDKFTYVSRLIEEAGITLGPVQWDVIWRTLVPSDAEWNAGRSGTWQSPTYPPLSRR